MTTTAIEVRSLSGSLVSTHTGNDALRDAIAAIDATLGLMLPDEDYEEAGDEGGEA